MSETVQMPAKALEREASWVDPLHDGPAAYRTPEDRPTLAEAQAWCKQLAGSHYENFHVATFFLPRAVRPHFESIYAYCRVADDLGDEVPDVRVASRLLAAFGDMLGECYDAPERSVILCSSPCVRRSWRVIFRASSSSIS